MTSSGTPNSSASLTPRTPRQNDERPVPKFEGDERALREAVGGLLTDLRLVRVRFDVLIAAEVKMIV